MNAIEKLTQRHMIIMYYHLYGETQQKIAEMMNLSLRHVSRIVNSPIFQDEFKRLSEEMKERVISNSAEVQQIIDCASTDAVLNLIGLMHNATRNCDKLRAIEILLRYSSLVSEKEKVVEGEKTWIPSEKTMNNVKSGLKLVN